MRLLDVSPLRESRDYRLLWTGQLISMTGSAVRTVAIPYQIYLLTSSSLAVGLVGLFQAVPVLVLSLFGGVIADRVDRRRLLIVVQTGLMLNSVALAVATTTGTVSVPLLYALTAVGGAFGALDAPARFALIPSLLERRRVQPAMALQQTQFQTAAVLGPAIAGVLIARVGLATAYWIDVLTYFAALAALALLRTTARPATDHPPFLRSLRDGIAFLLATPVLLSTMSLDFLATLFGNWRALLPYYAAHVFVVGPDGLGLLYAAPGAGALVVALTSGWTSGVRRQGACILGSVAVFGAAITVFGLLPRDGFVLALVCLAIAQGADAVSSIFRQTIVQLETPEHLRGRLNAINLMFTLGGPTLGQLEGGVVAQVWDPVVSVVSGGVLCIGAVGTIALLDRGLPRYEAATTAVAAR